MDSFFREGEELALNLPNRGPIVFGGDGKLLPSILDVYSRYGFYVFKNVIFKRELEDLESDFQVLKRRLPDKKGSLVDSLGRPALSVGCSGPNIHWAKPLSDPNGETTAAGGRYPVKMDEPKPQPDSPEHIVYLILGSLQFSEAHLRLYGHPNLLKIAASVNGEDFTPFNESIFIKEPGLGASVAWHQDGITHWNHPDWEEGIHGFNFMVQLYGSTAANGVWVVPGTHKLGKMDIKEMVRKNGNIYLKDAVPIISDPGDVIITNRQLVHGSFANTSEKIRVTFNQGFHKLSSVIGVKGGGLHNSPAVYTPERLRERSRLIALAIDSRSQRYPDESAYEYELFGVHGMKNKWTPGNLRILKDYNLLDLSI